jgi:hypothetical protein
MTSIRSLVHFSKLSVHQIEVAPTRVKANYTIRSNEGHSITNELIYSYDTVYFDKNKSEDVNLASMMLAQVALNYGLFFKTIEFDGLYDEVDRRFLKDMMENTSREILVNKFLRKNEFLKPPFDAVHTGKLNRYTAAEIQFSNTAYQHLTLHVAPHNIEYPADQDKYAILSSGGKDSLLTYGIIREFGEAHPIFINESGRHWFTAINAYKYFQATEPNTVKPWCNSDRIFNWMVRQMPFIKENFQSIRADMYPIRLWTVAVFLFGTLPVVRKRKMGNILIGNEYDTTIKGNQNGITHYNSLYDQSKYFDNAMTRYYKRKGWDIFQYSIVRSLSELLILKVLVKRYPELQKHQVSCHAAHVEDSIMRPCGNCEKCRRIVGMLTALHEDPRRCGYTESQITKCLQTLSSYGVKQIGSDAAHLYYLLLNQNLIEKNSHTLKWAKAHPEILQLRFDNERSNMVDLPKHIRKPLFGILQQHSEGSVRLQNRKWHTFALGNEDFETAHFLEKEK